MREGIFKNLLEEQMTAEENSSYQKIVGDLQAAMAIFEENITQLHQKVMARRAAEHKPAKVLEFKSPTNN